MTEDCSLEARLAVVEVAIPTSVEHLKERMDLRFQAAEAALDIQAGEIARRLDGLNGEAGRLREMQEHYIPREVAESKFRDINRDVVALQLFQSNLIGRMAMVGLIGGLVSAIATALVVRWVML